MGTHVDPHTSVGVEGRFSDFEPLVRQSLNGVCVMTVDGGSDFSDGFRLDFRSSLTGSG